MAEKSKSSSKGFLTFVRDLLVIVVLAFVISFGLKTFLVRAFYIPSGSMQETLKVDDRILVNQLVPGAIDVKRGDIVVFRDPGGWVHPQIYPQSSGLQSVLQKIGLSAEVTDEYVVKRVIGVGGDKVTCCDANGLIEVNGHPIREPYINLPDGVTKVSELEFEVQVPEGSVWVLGDNRYASKDSRYNQDQPGKGFVSEDEIVGKAFIINWPLNRIETLGNYPEVFAGVELKLDGNGESDVADDSHLLDVSKADDSETTENQ